MERIYLIKNPSIWMLDELIVFSRHVQFKVIFFRKPSEFYNERLDQLRSKGIEVVYTPFVYRIEIRKLFFCINFILNNVESFLSGYSLIVGIKSIWWFMIFDDRHLMKPVSIHAQFATQPALVAFLLNKYHHRKRIDYYFTFHAYDIYFENRWFVKLVDHSKKCFSISQYNIDYVMEKYKGLDRSKIGLSRLGAFSADVKPEFKNRSAVFQLGFISWFVEKKGIRYLLEAMKIISSRNKNIKLTLAGDGPLKKEIEKYITTNKLKDSINYVGKLNTRQKEDFFSNINALVLPAITLDNDQDGIPVVLMEAISYGLPIISTHISGIPEICVNNFNGFLIPEKNVAALVEAISTLYHNDLILKRFSSNSLQLFDNYKIEDNSFSKLKELNWIN